LDVELYRKGKKLRKFYALNEVVISQATLSRLIILKTKVDGLKLANFNADGLLVATPTGSTLTRYPPAGPSCIPPCRPSS
ncbi:MAG: NAD(+) kinase, partial [Patescibacteria group bacterium]